MKVNKDHSLHKWREEKWMQKNFNFIRKEEENRMQGNKKRRQRGFIITIALFFFFSTCFFSGAKLPKFYNKITDAYAADSIPGEITLTKTADQIPTACRTYNVSLGVSGNPIAGVGNVDVVLVIDRSLSMDSDRNAAANIAKQLTFLINNIAGNKVGLVSFSDTAKKHMENGSYLSSNKTAWTSELNGLPHGGASNIASGIKAAEEILADSSRVNDPNVNQAIVVISDGIASTTLTENPNDEYNDTASGLAIIQAQSANNAGMVVFAVNLSATTPTSPVNERPFGEKCMKGIGIDGYIDITSYSQDPKTDGDKIYNELSKLIFSAATNGIVTDTIDPRFQLVDGSISSNGGSAPTVAVVNGKQVITWNVGNVDQKEKTLSYKVKAQKEYPADTVVKGIVPTNESAYLTFTSAPKSGEVSPKNFPVPDVYVAPPLAVTLTDASVNIGTPITLGTGTSPSGENYMDVTGGWYVDADIMAKYPGRFTALIPQVLTYKWYFASDTNMEKPINPQVIPNVDTQYRVLVTDSFGCKATATMWTRPRGSLTVTKTVQNIETKDSNREFDIWVFGPGGNAWTVTLKNGESKTITGLRYGSYTVVETAPMNFKLMEISHNSLTISNENPHIAAVVTNKRTNDTWFYDEEKVTNSFTVNTALN